MHYEKGLRVHTKWDVQNHDMHEGNVVFDVHIDDHHRFNGIAYLIPNTEDVVPIMAKGMILLNPVDTSDQSDSPQPIAWSPSEFPDHALRRRHE